MVNCEAFNHHTILILILCKIIYLLFISEECIKRECVNTDLHIHYTWEVRDTTLFIFHIILFLSRPLASKSRDFYPGLHPLGELNCFMQKIWIAVHMTRPPLLANHYLLIHYHICGSSSSSFSTTNVPHSCLALNLLTVKHYNNLAVMCRVDRHTESLSTVEPGGGRATLLWCWGWVRVTYWTIVLQHENTTQGS